MMITEHNCEDYFLLYIDDELSTAERKAVEDFVAQHPQQAGLFHALLETKLPDDNTHSFLNKEALYKDEASDIGMNNYGDYFLLYTDNELTDEQKQNTERFVLQHPQLQEEFTLLQQTKLIADIIEYPNKAELYKKERRVLPLYMAGLSVAAALFAVLFFSGLLTQNHSSGTTLASTTVKQADKTITQPVQRDVSPKPIVNQKTGSEPEDVVAGKTIQKQSKEKTHSALPEETTPQETQIVALPKTSHEEVTVTTPQSETPAVQTIPVTHSTAIQAAVLKPLDETIAGQADEETALSLSDNNTAQPAVYKELNTNDDNHTLYVSGIQLNKNKVNGFLKSASRLLGGRAKQTEE